MVYAGFLCPHHMIGSPAVAWGQFVGEMMIGKTTEARDAFTLIELLIVVAIIAILAAIAVPNLLEAQTRAKAARVKADLRTVATALEAYRVDYNNYPFNDGLFNVLPKEITTPVSYISSAELVDPFTDKEKHPVYGDLARYYTYMKIVKHNPGDPEMDEFEQDATPPINRPPPIEAVDAPLPGFNTGAMEKYGKWRLVSNGPDRKYSDPPNFPTDAPLYGADVTYDPSNGTMSWGNILRTQRSPEGRTKW